MLIDAVFPMLLLKAFSFFSPKYKAIQPSMLKLDKAQMKDLEPLANEAVKVLWINLSPMNAFLLATALIYGGNLFSLDESAFTKS